MRKQPDAIPPHLPPPAQLGRPANGGPANSGPRPASPESESSLPTPPRGIPQVDDDAAPRPGYPSPPPAQ